MSATKIAGTMAQLLVRQWPSSTSVGSVSFLHTAGVLEAARKGTRAKAEAKKKASKKVVVAKEYVPLKKRLALQMLGGASPRRVEDHLNIATDNVWFTKYYRWKVYSLREALAMHRESHHETMLDAEDSLVNAYIELQMDVDKKNRFMENFQEVLKLPHNFDNQQQRNIMVISKSNQVIDYANEAGVGLAVGRDIIKTAQDNLVDFSQYNYILAEIDIIPELVAIRGLMKRQFPNTKNGTAATDIIPLIDRFMHGVEFRTERNKHHQDFGSFEVPFGRLNMTDEQLEDNLVSLLKTVENKKRRVKKSNELLSLVVIRSPPGREQFKIDYHELIAEQVAEAEVEELAQ